MARLTIKQQRFADEYIIRQRITAAEQLSKRYISIGELVDEKLVEEAVECISSSNTEWYQKKAARIILNIKLGSAKANDLIEKNAVVINRNDSLVYRWAKAVKSRDKVCRLCGNPNDLCAHHISHWSDDPINRINIDNGITLCNECHSRQHPELSPKMFGGGNFVK